MSCPGARPCGRRACSFGHKAGTEGSKFTMSEKSGAFTGDGELTGEAWKWTEWKSGTKLDGRCG